MLKIEYIKCDHCGMYGVNPCSETGMPGCKYFNAFKPSLEERVFPPQDPRKPDGGPSSYYDFPEGMCTANDLFEYLAGRWGRYSLHFKDIMKASFRFGSKDGTSVMYDARKIVYSGLRLIIMAGGKKAARDYLKQLLNDKQFKD